MIGVEFVSEGAAARAAGELFEQGVLVGHTPNHPRVMRLEPPLVISPEQLDSVLAKLESALEVVSR
jgi:putrescine aminotransferase